MEGELVNLIGLANRLRLPQEWLKDEALAGRIPCLRVSRNKLLFNPAAVKRALAERAADGRLEVSHAG